MAALVEGRTRRGVFFAAAAAPDRDLGTADKRSIFAIPRGDVVYLGTTDTSYEHGADPEPPVLRDDVEYLLEPVPRYFDTAPLHLADCVTAWAGLRPLLAEPGKAPAELSRRDEIALSPSGVVTIAGGKLTGYRKMGVDVLARVAEVLGRSLAPGHDEDTPLPGGDFDGDLDALAARVARASGVEAHIAARLVRLYGTESEAVIARGRRPLVAGAAVLEGEVEWAIDVEGALDALDVVYRRTRAALYDPDARAALAEPVAQRMALRLGWSAEHTTEQTRAVRERLAADLAFREETQP